MPPDIGMLDKKTCLSSPNKPQFESISNTAMVKAYFTTEVGGALVTMLYMQPSSINLTDLLFDSCNECPMEIYGGTDWNALVVAKRVFST